MERSEDLKVLKNIKNEEFSLEEIPAVNNNVFISLLYGNKFVNLCPID